MIFTSLLFAHLLLASAEVTSPDGYCSKEDKLCNADNGEGRRMEKDQRKLIFYDVNPPEGFNLRRDVYMRFSIMLAEGRKTGSKLDWHLVLPPWHHIYHWKSDTAEPKPWSTFFNLTSLKSYSPVLEMHEAFSSPILEIDTLYVLQNYADAFENGVFEEKWVIDGPCDTYIGQFWGYSNVKAKETVCVRFQGKISQLWEIIATHPKDEKVMFAHGEIPLHDTYGTKPYWNCRKSMKFIDKLIKAAETFISEQLKCNTRKCPNYISVHWRRQDFARYREDVPSIKGTAKQIAQALRNTKLKTKKVFIATDALADQQIQLKNKLSQVGISAYFLELSDEEKAKHSDGELAIIDQIICSRSAYFIGTHESTFTYRIQEEREILGFDSSTTFNRLCPDKGICESPSKWTIVN